MTRAYAIVVDRWDRARGGLEHYAGELARELVARGERLLLVCARLVSDPPEGSETLELGGEGRAFYERADAELARDPGTLVLSFRHPGRAARVFLPLGGLLEDSLAARRGAEPAGLRALNALGRALSPKTRAFLARERAFFAAGAGRLVLASSAKVRDDITRRYPDFGGQVEVTGLPVDERRFRPPAGVDERQRTRSKVFGVDDDSPCLLFVGHDARRKGLRAAHAVLARLRLRKLGARLVVAGRGSEALRDPRAGLVGLGEVDTAPLYRAADLLLAPSFEDNLSFAVLEALASGLPVVTSAADGASAFVTDPALGRVVSKPRDVAALDRATLAMLDREALDAGKRAARREAVRSCFRAAHFDALFGRLARWLAEEGPA